MTLGEVEVVIHDFSSAKSLGPDRWSVEFYLGFFYLVGSELLAAVEQYRQEGYVCRYLNATYITLIPKRDRRRAFGDFRSISLCNLAYKVVTKFLSNRLKPLLTEVISREQFGFLKNRKILEAVDITQEALHSIKTRNLSALIVKMDLIKAYDRVDWTLLRLILLHVGLSAMTVNWFIWVVLCQKNLLFSSMACLLGPSVRVKDCIRGALYRPYCSCLLWKVSTYSSLMLRNVASTKV